MQQQLQLLHEGSAAGHYAPQLPHQSERLGCVQTAAVERARLVRELEHLKQTKSARCQTIAPSLAPAHTHTHVPVACRGLCMAPGGTVGALVRRCVACKCEAHQSKSCKLQAASCV